MRIYNDTNRFTIDWTLNTLCTYKCSYCHPGLYNGTNFLKSKVEDPAIVKNFLETIKRYVQGRSVHIYINGGEPTISPSLETIIDFCAENNWCAYVNTNGSRSLEWWQEYAKKIYKVTISYHPEAVVDEEIFEKVEYIGTQTNVGVFTLMFPPYWEKSVNAYNKFKSMPNVTIAPSRVFRRDEGFGSADKSYDYTQEQLDWLNDNSTVRFSPTGFPPPQNNYYGNSFIEENGVVTKFDEVEYTNNRKNTFLGWQCNLGVDHILIRADGDIMQSACRQATRIGTILDFKELSPAPTTCHTEWCMCTADVLIPKRNE